MQLFVLQASSHVANFKVGTKREKLDPINHTLKISLHDKIYFFWVI